MKLLHTSDWHVGKTMRGRSRHVEHRAMFDEMVATVEEHGIDTVLVCGDQFDTGAPAPESEALVYDTLLRLSDLATVVVISGNHDNANRLAAVKPMLERSGVIIGATPRGPGDGGTVTVDTSGGELRVALLPFVPQRNIVRAADLMELESAKHTAKYADHVRRMVEALCADFGSGNTVDVVLTHGTVVGNAGVKLGGGEMRSHTIFTYYLPPTVFPDVSHYVALGHLHQQQVIPAAAPIRYSGAPMHLDFGETPSQRGALIVDVEAQMPAKVELAPFVSGRPLATLRGTVDQVLAGAAEQPDNAFLRVFIEEAPRPGLVDEVQSQVPNAVDVRVSNPAVTSITPDQLDAVPDDPETLFIEYLEAEGIVDPSVRETFQELLDDLQARDNHDLNVPALAATESS